MIHRNSQEGLKLDVAGLNEITVLIDRAETELTEVSMNTWQRDLDEPPRHHTQKEQAFHVTSGHDRVRLGADEYPAEPGSLFYVPAGLVHQTITKGSEPLVDFLFDAFLGSSKEGHASFAQHIQLVMETRRQQALTQRAVAGDEPPPPATKQTARAVPPQPATASHSRDTLIDRADTQRIEVVSLALPSNHGEDALTDDTKEQTILVSKGAGTVRINHESGSVVAGEIVYIPRGAAATLMVGNGGLQAVSFGVVMAL